MCVTFLENEMDTNQYFFNLFKQRAESKLITLKSIKHFVQSFGIDMEDVKKSILPNISESLKNKQLLDIEAFSKITVFYKMNLKDFKDNVNNAYNFNNKCDPIYLIKAYWGTIQTNIVEK